MAAVAKVDDLHFDAVLHASHAQDHIHLAPLDFPRPTFGLAIDAGSKGQEQKLATALHKLAEEDPCFQVEHLPDTNATRSDEHTSEPQSLMRITYSASCLQQKNTRQTQYSQR